MSGAATLNKPRPVRVKADAVGRPLVVDGLAVEGVRESWLVEDRWWTAQPLRRRYWELLTVNGRNLVVFRDLVAAAGRGAHGSGTRGNGGGVGVGSGTRGGDSTGAGAVGGWFTQRD